MCFPYTTYDQTTEKNHVPHIVHHNPSITSFSISPGKFDTVIRTQYSIQSHQLFHTEIYSQVRTEMEIWVGI
jgi:hypothetical protein